MIIYVSETSLLKVYKHKSLREYMYIFSDISDGSAKVKRKGANRIL